ncbi:MAG: branched-chain amino acid ABC transporter permease [Thermoprotei archaeon]|nr:MAG: branched-chain amino acid ABC transporter permease [Thermoprotei archaeon]
MIIEPIYGDALVFASLLTLLSLGLTLTFLTTKVPNFAHGSFATVGIYTTLTLNRIYGLSPYAAAAVAFIVGALVALAQYDFILRPLSRRGASIVTLMVATIAFEFILLASLNIYADFITETFKVKARYFSLRREDFVIEGIRGLLMVAPSLVVALAIVLHLCLTRTKFGVAMRAAIENPSLAGSLGVNVDLVYHVSWFLAGGLAGLAGGLMPLWFIGNPDTGSLLLVSIFAASVAGGFYSIYGGFIGGYLIGLAEVLGTNFLSKAVGAWMISYRMVIPLMTMTVVLLLFPKGVTGLISELRASGKLSGLLRRWSRRP